MEFTPEQQEFINGLVAKEKNSTRDKLTTLESQLTEIVTEKNSTEEQRVKLQEQIEVLTKDLRTKEEQAKYEAEKITKQSQAQLEKLQDEATNWRTKYVETSISRSLLDAASSKDAYNPHQIQAILGPTTKMLDDGSIKTTLKVKGEELLLTPDEAVARMSEHDEFANLFKSNLNSGSGFNPPSGRRKEVDLENITSEEYMALRKEGRLPVG